MQEPEKATYTSIKFPELFMENDMTWRNKNNEFIYTVRTPTGRDQIEQITTKNFN